MPPHRCRSSDFPLLALITHSLQGHLSLPPSLLPSCLPTATLTPAGVRRPCLAWGQAWEGQREAQRGQACLGCKEKAENRARGRGLHG